MDVHEHQILEKKPYGYHVNSMEFRTDSSEVAEQDVFEGDRNAVVSYAAALNKARIITDINAIQYPEGIRSPHPELNRNAEQIKFRYDRDFLLQFMRVCKAKLPPLYIVPSYTLTLKPRGGPCKQGPIGLGFSPAVFGNKAAHFFGGMGNFATVGASKPSSEDRFASASRVAVVSSASSMHFRGGSPRPMTRVTTTSQGDPGAPSAPRRTRTRTKRNKKDDAKSEVPGGKQQNLTPVMPLQVSANRWDRKAFTTIDAESPAMADRKVRGLLNKLAMANFDSISDQIISWANKSENEKDGISLLQVIRQVYDQGTAEEGRLSELFARLCRKMMEQISAKVQDDGIKNNEGKPIAGGQLFRKYLLDRCREDFERSWVARQTTAAVKVEATDYRAMAQADGKDDEETVLYSDSTAQKAERQGFGLVKFIGELFKLQMITESIIHKYVKTFLGDVDHPDDEKIEALCKLLTSVGGVLDTPKARARVDVYFCRMMELMQSPKINSRIRHILLDSIELRQRKWVSWAAVKEKAAAEKALSQHQASIPRGGSKRVAGGNSALPRPLPKVGDLANFGKIGKGSGSINFGPRSVFTGEKGTENKRESTSHTSSSPNMFSMLGSRANKAAGGASKLKAPIQRKPETMSDDAVKKKIAEDTKEFFAIRNLQEAEVYFTALPSPHHHKLVDSFASKAVESKEADVQLVADFFGQSTDKGSCSAAAFEEGFSGLAGLIEDIAIDAPKAVQLFALMIKGAKLDKEARARIAAKSLDGDKLLALLEQ